MKIQTHTQEIEQMVEGLNDAWLQRKFDNLDQYLHSQVVLIETGTLKSITGRRALISSYEEFMDTAEVSNFKILDMNIHVFDSTAIAQYTFRIKYQVESTKYDEKGMETLVFHHHNNRWVVVWRTQQPGL